MLAEYDQMMERGTEILDAGTVCPEDVVGGPVFLGYEKYRV